MPELLYPGLGTGRDPERPKLLPTYVPQVGEGRAEKLQNSLELRKTGPSWGVCPSPVCSTWVLGGGPGRVRRRRPHTRGLVQAAAVLEREQV